MYFNIRAHPLKMEKHQLLQLKTSPRLHKLKALVFSFLLRLLNSIEIDCLTELI